MTLESKNYVAAWVDYSSDNIIVLERDSEGTLFRKKFLPPYYFYVEDEQGEYTSLFDNKLSLVEFASKEEYHAAIQHCRDNNIRTFESDIPPLKRILMDRYYDIPAPLIHHAFLDIEVDYKQSLGFAGPQNPYGPINAVTIYQSWTNKFLTYVLPPMVDGVLWTNIPGNSVDVLNAEITKLVVEGLLRKDKIPEIVICKTEYELLNYLLIAIEDADIISGWNSEFYDIPYIAERLLLAGGKNMLARLERSDKADEYPCIPKKEMVDKFGTPEPVYKFRRRSHLDYMKLFQKFTFEGRVSYALGNILEEEVGMGKLEYAGTLEQMYHNEFPKFVAYNFRDTDGLLQLDEKFKFIALANQMAHENTVHFDAVLGTVGYVETGITNHAHNALKRIVHDKVIGNNNKVEGAIVMTPQKGLHEWIGSIDLKSLYPNTIRSLNISPEMMVGQFDDGEDAWVGIKENSVKTFTLVLSNNTMISKSGEEWKAFLLDQKWAISAYGTVFDQSRGRGVVADILGFWYNERKRLQKEKKMWAKRAEELPDGPEKDNARRQEEHFDLLQLTKKISMNSLYGALLNVAFRFGHERMGASVTATGRAITTHMLETIGLFITGTHNKLVKTTEVDDDGKIQHAYRSPNDAIIYGDTDSGYFKTYATNKEEAIETANLVAEQTNATFPKFMADAFSCQPEFTTMIEGAREIVGERGLWLSVKKKYLIKVIDLDGKPVNKLKTMGSEIKKSDTPKIIQEFLKCMVGMVLDGKSYEEVCEYVNAQRKSVLTKLNVFQLGVAKQVNNLDKFIAEYNAPGSCQSLDKNGKMRKLTVPGHVRAACNYNSLVETYDKGAKPIKSGDKVLIFYLKPNGHAYKAIAFPAELTQFPPWFKDVFAVDIKMTETKMFDSKMVGIFDALNKDVPSPQSVLFNQLLEF